MEKHREQTYGHRGGEVGDGEMGKKTVRKS